MDRRRLFLCGALWLLGCRGSLSEQEFWVTVEARAGERPIPGLRVLNPADQREVGRTDEQGRALFAVTGREGDSIEVQLEPPCEAQLVGAARQRVMLRRVGSLRQEPAVALLVHTVALRWRRLRYVFVVNAPGAAGLPVQVAGSERTRLNRHGVGLFVYQGLPGEEIPVTVQTEGARLLPRSPTRSFALPEQPEALYWRVALEPEPAPVPVARPAPPRKRRRGPIDLDQVTRGPGAGWRRP